MSESVQYNVRDGQGNVYGPATVEMLRAWVREGRIVAGMAIAPEGTDNWVDVTAHPGLSDLFGTPASTATTATATTATITAATPAAPATAPLDASHTPVTRAGDAGGAPLQYGGYADPNGPTMNVMGLISFIVGIVALLSSVSVCCCYGAINGPLGLVAVVLGLLAMGQNRKTPGAYSNHWMSITGTILGAIALLAAVAGIILFIVMLANGGASGFGR